MKPAVVGGLGLLGAGLAVLLGLVAGGQGGPGIAALPGGLAGGLALAGLGLAAAGSALLLRALRRSERALREAVRAHAGAAARGRELDRVAASVPELLFRTDVGGVLAYANRRWEAACGRPAGEVVGRALHELVVPADAQAVRTLWRAGDDGEARTLRASIVDAAGAQRCFEFSVVPLREASGSLAGFAGSARDVTEQAAAQDELHTQLAFVDSLLETSPLPMSVLDRQGRYLRVNRAWEAYTGRARDEVLGRQAADFYDAATAARHGGHDARLLAEGGQARYEIAYTHADGRRGELFVSKSVVRGPRGEPMAIVAAFMDITEFRQAERATRMARDAAEELLRAKSEFVANMSHELRTPLQSILGFSELGLRRARADARVTEMFEDVHRAGQRMLALVNDLLDLSKLESGVGRVELHREDVRELIRDVAHEFEPMLAARHLRLELALSPAQLVAQVDATRLQQVVRNLLANALRFSPDGALIEIRADAGADGQVHVEVADRGPGIPDGELERIFEAFVQSSRTKDGAGGTGLGLAICREIMRRHDGTIRARHRDGGGSVFELVLPSARFGDTTPASL